jgi:hypothetical protein
MEILDGFAYLGDHSDSTVSEFGNHTKLNLSAGEDIEKRNMMDLLWE